MKLVICVLDALVIISVVAVTQHKAVDVNTVTRVKDVMAAVKPAILVKAVMHVILLLIHVLAVIAAKDVIQAMVQYVLELTHVLLDRTVELVRHASQVILVLKEILVRVAIAALLVIVIHVLVPTLVKQAILMEHAQVITHQETV